MTSPFKTHETMDLARALLEEESNTRTNCSGNSRRMNNNDDVDIQKSRNRYPLNFSEFDNVVVSKDSSTELIPTHLVEESCAADFSSSSTKLTASNSNNNNRSVLVRDLNAGKGMLDDDGKPVVGKVFSRVINVSGVESKPKQLKSHHPHRGRSSSSCCRDSRHGGSCGGSCQSQGHHHHDKERASSARPQSGQQLVGGQMGGARQKCPRCNRQFSDESVMKNHIVFCSGSSKEIM